MALKKYKVAVINVKHAEDLEVKLNELSESGWFVMGIIKAEINCTCMMPRSSFTCLFETK